MKTKVTDDSIVEHLIDCDADPFTFGGWTVESHKKGGQIAWDPSKVRLYLSEEQTGKKYVEGNKLRKELKDQPVLNANVLDYLLAHHDLIPEDWKNKHVFFWGTIYCYRDGSGLVLCLDWDGDRWEWNGFCPDGVFSSHSPAAVSAS